MSERQPLIASLRWPLVVLILGSVGLLVAERACRAPGALPGAVVDSVERLGKTAVTIAERFQSGRITTTFTAAIPQLDPRGGLFLELAAFEATEVFTRENERSVFFDLVSLGTTVTEIRVPTTYRYHLRLNDTWRLDVREQSCLVLAPRIRPTLPPAIHTSGLEKRSERGWLRFNVEEQMADLERSITPTLSARAGRPEHLELVREGCRRRVAEFVRGWLLREDHWRQDRFRAIVVRFEDEAETATPPHPTVVFGDLQ
jgi:hypothetical protein